MRPPEFTGGNIRARVESHVAAGASMRPPEFTGGNDRDLSGGDPAVGQLQ